MSRDIVADVLNRDTAPTTDELRELTGRQLHSDLTSGERPRASAPARGGRPRRASRHDACRHARAGRLACLDDRVLLSPSPCPEAGPNQREDATDVCTTRRSPSRLSRARDNQRERSLTLRLSIIDYFSDVCPEGAAPRWARPRHSRRYETQVGHDGTADGRAPARIRQAGKRGFVMADSGTVGR